MNDKVLACRLNFSIIRAFQVAGISTTRCANSMRIGPDRKCQTASFMRSKETHLFYRYDGNPLCQNPLNAPYCVVNPKAAPPAPPMAMPPLSATLMNSGLGLKGSCVGEVPCTCSDGRNGTTQCGNEAKDAVCQCKGKPSYKHINRILKGTEVRPFENCISLFEQWKGSPVRPVESRFTRYCGLSSFGFGCVLG